jgi:HPt (histidine-containing phosphotransfer) domain-containing protein
MVDTIEADAQPGGRMSSPPLSPCAGAAPGGQGVAQPAVDLAHLARMTLGDLRLRAEVLALFDRQADILLARMRQARPAAIAAFAHTLKGSARGIGAWAVAAAAERLERGTTTPAEIDNAIDALAAAVTQVRAATQELGAASSSAA